MLSNVWNYLKSTWLPVRSSWRIISIPGGYQVEYYRDKTLRKPQGRKGYLDRYDSFKEAEQAVHANTLDYETAYYHIWYYTANGTPIGTTKHFRPYKYDLLK